MACKYNILIIILLVLIVIKLFFPKLISKFAELNISGTGLEPSSFFDLKTNIACVPGPGPKADYYSRTDDSYGICGGQQAVNDAMRKYTINDN